MLGSTGYLLLIGKKRSALFMLAAVGTGILASLLLKTGFDRPRPALVPHGSIVYTKSFPSGHSMMAAVTYLTIGALLMRAHVRRAARGYILGAAILVTVLVGVSRVYLGVHWPTDVLAGWAAGGLWASTAWLIVRWLQREGQVEKPDEATPVPANA
jgi:undecaprenyl-diphosphatase